MKSSQFMFINKDAQSKSLSHSNRNERIQIHSHVQKGRRYKKADVGAIHATRLPVLKPGRRLNDADDPGDHPSDENGSSSRPVTTTRPDQVPLQSERHPSASPKHKPSSRDPNIDPLLWALSPNSSSNHSSPQRIPVFPASAEESFDPFDVTCVKVDQPIHSLLQYFLRVYYPNIWHIEREVRSDHNYLFRQDAMTLMQGCLHDEYNMYSLVASMASYMTYIDGIPVSGDGNLYVHKALRASQKYVQSGQPITTRMVFNIFHVACSEWFRYNVDAAYVHFKAAKTVVDEMGGLGAVEGPLAELLVTGDAYVAAELSTKPLWTDSDFESGDNHPMTEYGVHELQKLLSGCVQIGAGLLTSSQQEIIPAGLRWIILDLAVVLSVLRSSLSSDPAVPKPPVGCLHWVHIRTLAIRLRLLAMELDDARSDAVRIAVVLWIFLSFTVAGRKRSAKVVAPLLRQALLGISEEEWHGHEEVHQWVLTIGALSATLGSDEHTWFVGEINALPVGELQDMGKIFHALVALSARFFYLESAQKTVMTALADDLLHMRMPQRKTKSKSPNS